MTLIKWVGKYYNSDKIEFMEVNKEFVSIKLDYGPRLEILCSSEQSAIEMMNEIINELEAKVIHNK